jgi:hypothetical protein
VAGHDVNEIFRIFGTMTPTTKAQELVASQFTQTFSEVILDRNKRYLHSAESLSWVMWVAVIGGGAITIGMSFILYMEHAWPHVLMTAVISALIGALLLIMSLLSRPFVGPLAIQPEPFETSLHTFDDVDHGN